MERNHLTGMFIGLIGILVGMGAMGVYNHYSTGSKQVTVAVGKTLEMTCEMFDNDVGQIVVPTSITGVADTSTAKFGCKVIDRPGSKVAAK